MILLDHCKESRISEEWTSAIQIARIGGPTLEKVSFKAMYFLYPMILTVGDQLWIPTCWHRPWILASFGAIVARQAHYEKNGLGSLTFERGAGRRLHQFLSDSASRYINVVSQPLWAVPIKIHHASCWLWISLLSEVFIDPCLVPWKAWSKLKLGNPKFEDHSKHTKICLLFAGMFVIHHHLHTMKRNAFVSRYDRLTKRAPR